MRHFLIVMNLEANLKILFLILQCCIGMFVLVNQGT